MKKILIILGGVAGLLLIGFIIFSTTAKQPQIVVDNAIPQVATSTLQTSISSTSTPNTPKVIAKPSDKPTSPINVSKWKTYTYKNFSIDFPEDPQITDESNEGYTVTTYRGGQEDGTQYFITEVIPKSEIVIPYKKKALQSVVAEVIQKIGTLDIALDETSLHGYEQINFMVSIPDGPRTYHGRFAVIGNNLYEMRAVYMVRSKAKADFGKFTDSFHAR